MSDLTPSVIGGQWEANNSKSNISQISTTGTGVGMLCNIVTDSNGDPTFTIVNSGFGYAKDEVVTFDDPGSTSYTASLTVTSASIYKTIEIRGVAKVTDLSEANSLATDSTDPEIDLIWHESLVFGGLLAVIGIGFNFLISKKLKDRLDQ